jgi:RNA polymerase sigma-70 factor (ECF subfamily)
LLGAIENRWIRVLPRGARGLRLVMRGVCNFLRNARSLLQQQSTAARGVRDISKEVFIHGDTGSGTTRPCSRRVRAPATGISHPDFRHPLRTSCEARRRPGTVALQCAHHRAPRRDGRPPAPPERGFERPVTFDAVDASLLETQEPGMDRKTPLFERHRPRLFGLAYRMLGTPADAEDVVHDAWLRLHAQELDALADPEAWLVTVTTRLALDRLRRAKAERADYTGPWLPEPLAPQSEQPDAERERAETLTLSFLLLLERLSPDERAAFLLHEVFDYSHAEAARILDIAEDASRQRVHRAKTRLREGRPRFEVEAAAQRRLLDRFVAAMAQPTMATLRALFAEDAIHISDGGGVVRATLRPLQGAERLARLYLQLAHHLDGACVRYEAATLNGAPALFLHEGDLITSAMWIETDGERITAIHALRHPGKLAALSAVTKTARASSLS